MKLRFFLFLSAVLIVLSHSAVVVLAATGGGGVGGSTGGGGVFGGTGGGGASGGTGGSGNFCPPGSACLDNPLKASNFIDLIKTVLDALFIIALPVAVLAIVYAGFLFVSARGNPEKLGKAKDNLLYVVVGIAVFFGAWVIATIISNTIGTLLR